MASECDGFVGLPGFPSLYFWTQILPPAVIAGAWPVNLEEDRQRAIVETMQTYERPCALYNRGRTMFWTQGRPVDSEQPLVKYIETSLKRVKVFGADILLVKK